MIESNKRVCMLTSVHPSFDTRIFHKECKTLVNAGYDVTLIAQHNKDEVVDDVKIIALSTPKNRLERMTKVALRLFRLALKQKAKIYHFHDPELIPIGLLLKLLGKKVIYDVHEDYKESILLSYYLPQYTRKIIAWLVDFLERTSSRFFDGVVSATDTIHKKFQNRKRSIVVTNYPFLNSFFDKVYVQKEQNKDKNIFNAIYVGGLAPERGITQIVQAMEYLENVRLILCGEFSPLSYEKQIRSIKGFEKVDYYGFVKYKQLPKYISQADVGIVCFLPEPNHINAMPNKLFEYMAAGLPVIASNFPLWKEIVEGNNCGICVDPLKPEEIARAVEYLIEHPEEAKKMGERGRQVIMEKCNWEKESEKLVKLYEKLCER